VTRARKCFQKALALDVANEAATAGPRLADLHVQLGEHADAVALYRRVRPRDRGASRTASTHRSPGSPVHHGNVLRVGGEPGP